MTAPAYLFRLADRLGEVEAGSRLADQAIHQALGRDGTAPPYTTDEAAARTLLPPGFEALPPLFSAKSVYASCRHVGIAEDGFNYPHHGNWGHTLPLALCGATVRAHGAMMRRAAAG